MLALSHKAFETIKRGEIICFKTMIFIKLLDMHLETRFSLPFRLNKDYLKPFFFNKYNKVLTYNVCSMIIHFITKLRAHLDFFWVEGRGEKGGVKESRVELAENRLILD